MAEMRFGPGVCHRCGINHGVRTCEQYRADMTANSFGHKAKPPELSKVVGMKPKVRPLKSTYEPNSPYKVEREDWDDGTISYEVQDTRPESYRMVCTVSEHDNDHPKHEAEQIARALNLLVQYGMEKLLPGKDDDI